MEIEKVFELLRVKGFRITVARQTMLAWILLQKKPFTSKDLIVVVRDKGLQVDDSTVYRELSFLLAENLITSVMLKPGVPYYESALLDHHHHLLCRDCGDIQDVACSREKSFLREVEQQAKDLGFEIREHQVEFHGVCRNCQ